MPPIRRDSTTAAAWIAGGYVVAGFAWIHLGTWLSARSARGIEDLEHSEVVKGSVFVATTALLLFLLLRREFSRRAAVADALAQKEHEQRDAATRLAEERARLLEAQAVAHVGSWEIDLPSRSAKWSEETHRIFGTDPAAPAPAHRAFLDLVHPDDRRRVNDAFIESLQGDEIRIVEHRILRPDGTVRDVEQRWRSFRGPDGRAVRCVGTCRDVTEQRRAEAALRESRRMVEHIVNAVPVRVFWKDRDLRYLGCNAAFARDAGLADASEIVGRDDFQLAWRDQAELYRADDRRVLGTGAPRLLIEEPQTTPGGETVSLLTSKIPLRDVSGEVVGVLGTYMDVTALRRAEEHQARLATAVEQAAEAVVITDTAGTILYVNPAFEKVTGWTRDEAVGQNPRILKSGRHDDAFYREMWTTLAAGLDWRGRVVNRCRDGRLLEEDVVISPVRDSGGRVCNYVAVKRDVTDQVRLEQQLLQSRKMEAVGQLAGGVAHDFNNLLMVINGTSEMILAKLPPGEPLRELVSDIAHAGERAGNLTRQLLAFSRRQVLEPRLLDLNTVVADTEKMLRRLIGEDVILTLRPSPVPAPVCADPGQIEQVIVNLALNARDAMPRGGWLTLATSVTDLDEAHCRLHPGAVPGPHVRLSVSDTGHGMDEATLGRLFEPFFTTKEPGKGTGLGLATVHGIVRQSGGHITVESRTGAGSTFHILLPRAEGAMPGPPTAEASHGMPHGTETVLLVEDEDAVRTLGRQILERCGYHVLDSADGERALEVAARHDGPVHLLISDVVMPRLGGRALAERFRAARPECRVLFVSGYTDDAVLRHGVQESEVAFLQKPFTASVLARKVRQILDEAAAARG